MPFRESILVFVLIVLSGVGDALGFFYASKVWQNDVLSWPALAKGALGWTLGIAMYVIALKYLSRMGVTSAEIQTAVWFAVTIIGVVVFSGKFFSWPRLEQVVAVLVLAGLGWLMARTGE